MTTLYSKFGEVNTKFGQIATELFTKQDKETGKHLSTDDFNAASDYSLLRARLTTKADVGLASVDNVTTQTVREGTTKEDVGLGNVENYGVASEAEAQAGTTATKYVTPQNGKQFLNERVNSGVSAPINADGKPDGSFYFNQTEGKLHIKVTGSYKEAEPTLRSALSNSRHQISIRERTAESWTPAYKNTALYVVGTSGRINFGDHFNDRNRTWTPISLGQHDVKNYWSGVRGIFVIHNDGKMYYQGLHGNGSGGIGNTPYGVAWSRWVQESRGFSDWKTVHTYWRVSYALRENGTLWTTGMYYGSGFSDFEIYIFTQLGTGVYTEMTGSRFFGSALRADGSMWGWGSNWAGQLGNINLGSPVYGAQRIGTDNDWQSLMVNSFTVGHNYAIKNNGTLWVTGQNNGYLGNNNAIDYDTWGQIGTDTDWHKVSAGQEHTLAIKQDGTLWAWGKGNYGQNGSNNGDTLVPVMISSDTDWVDIFAQDSGEKSGALKSDGRLYTWGRNDYGTLFLPSSIASTHKPTLVKNFYPVKKVVFNYQMAHILIDV